MQIDQPHPDMIVGRPHPDEFVRGYRGRLRVLNNFPTIVKFMAALRRHVHPGGTPESECPAARTLALACSTPIQPFVRGHSLLPFHRAVAIRDADILHGDPTRFDLIDSFGTRVVRSEARLCVDCLKEDFDYWRFAYWRRAHQLPGIHWCIKHGTQLSQCRSGKKAFEQMPDLSVAQYLPFDENEIVQMRNNTVLQRYVEIVSAFLELDRPTSLVHARYRIAERAKTFHLRIGARGRQPALTDLALDQIPSTWLFAEYPTLQTRRKGEFFSPIDNVTLGLASTQSVSLALALLFPSADEAIQYWLSDMEGLPDARRTLRHYGRDFWVSESTFRIYVKSRGNHCLVGEALGQDPSFSRIGLIAAGLPALGSINLESVGRAVLAFKAGASFDHACTTHGVSRDEVADLLLGGSARVIEALRLIIEPPRQHRNSDKTILGQSLTAVKTPDAEHPTDVVKQLETTDSKS